LSDLMLRNGFVGWSCH